MTARVDLPVSGMTCVRSVEHTLSAVPGVTQVKVDLENSAADVEYDPDLVAASVPVDAVLDLGYKVPV
jgi:copper chaperone CopZ